MLLQKASSVASHAGNESECGYPLGCHFLKSTHVHYYGGPLLPPLRATRLIPVQRHRDSERARCTFVEEFIEGRGWSWLGGLASPLNHRRIGLATVIWLQQVLPFDSLPSFNNFEPITCQNNAPYGTPARRSMARAGRDHRRIYAVGAPPPPREPGMRMYARLFYHLCWLWRGCPSNKHVRLWHHRGGFGVVGPRNKNTHCERIAKQMEA